MHQHGVDVFLDLTGPDGGSTRADRPIGRRGAEELLVAGAGIHTLVVAPWPDSTRPSKGILGSYEIVASGAAVDDATPTRLAAERACERALVDFSNRDEAARDRVAGGLEACAEGLGAVGDRSRQGRALFDLGRALNGWRRQPERQVASLRRAAGLFLAAGEPAAEAEALNFLAKALAEGGRGDEAVAVSAQVTRRFSPPTAGGQLAVAYGNLGEHHSNRGQLQQALGALIAAYELPAEASCARANVLGHLGVAYRRVGAYDRAHAPLDDAVAMGESEGCAAADRAVILARRAEVLHALGSLDAAARDAARAVELGGAGRRGLTRLVQGQIAVARRDLDVAETALAEARAAYAADGVPRSEAIVLLGLGLVALARGEAEPARQRFAEALAIAEAREPGGAIAASALHGRARAELAAGETKRALATVGRSLRVVESLRQVPGGRTLRADFLASRHSHYDLRVEILMRLDAAEPGAGWGERALHACEEARARSLLDTLAGLGTVAAAADRPPRAAELEGEIAAREEELVWFDLEADQVRRLRRRIETLELELESQVAATPLAAPVLDAAAIRRRVVDDGGLFLSYHLGELRSFLWVVDRQGIESHELAPRQTIDRLARRVHRDLAASAAFTHRDAARSGLAELSRLLLAPAAGRLGGGERLLIAAEGALLYVPFAALPLPGAGERPLVDAHEVTVVPSASALAEQRRRLAARPPAPGRLAVVADPVFAGDDPRLSPRPAAGGLAAGPPAPARRAFRGGELFSRLPHTASEAEWLLALVPAGEPTLDLRGFDATAGAVRGGALAGYDYVHLATHALLADDPRLVFSLFTRDGEPRPDALLRSREIYHLDLPAELVTLSACSSGLGEEVTGEGLVGFTQGFFAAGARRVLVSVWEVGDESTAELMRRFYAGLLARRLSPAAALREAQRSMRREAHFRAPYYWAGFQLQGEPL